MSETPREIPPQESSTLRFRGGPLASLVPLATFLVLTVFLVIRGVGGSSATTAMILSVMLGISLGMLLSRSPARYSELIFTLMANRTATVAVVCWLWAGAFSQILSDSGLVNAIVWLGWELQLTGRVFTVCVFVCAALFAVSVGTGLGTVVGFTAVFYPAGVALGADPGALMGAIFSGGAFGDNLAPVSDTTIVSAATQETDVGGVVRSRLKYVFIAAAIAAVLFYLFGGSGTAADLSRAQQVLEGSQASSAGLPMLIPGVIVFVVAMSGGHFLAALTLGIAVACIMGPLTGAIELGTIFSITPEGGVTGSVVDGAMGLVPTAILTLLLVSAIGLLEASGFLVQLMEWLHRTVARSVRGAEAAIIALISIANLCVSVNTVAMITTGPLANRLRKRHGIHAYRSANLLDTVSCSFPYVLPYAATITAAIGIQEDVSRNYPEVPVLSWWEQGPYIFYGLVLFPVMVVAVITGYGRRRG